MRRAAILITLVGSTLLIVGSASAQLTIGQITPGSRLEDAGIKQGDIVYFVVDSTTKPNPKGRRSKPIKSVDQLESEINLVRGGSAALIYRRGSSAIETTDIVGPAGPTGVIVNSLPPPNSGNPLSPTNYEISITTGAVDVSPEAVNNLLKGLFGGVGDVTKIGDGPGTDSNVFIEIVGTNGKASFGPFSGARNGYLAGANLFEKGSTETLRVTGVDVGVVQHVTIRRDDTNPNMADWQIKRIVVKKTPPMGVSVPKSWSWVNPAGVWLLDTEDHSYPLN